MKDIFEKVLCDFDKRKYKLNALGIGTKYGLTNKYGVDVHEGEGLKFVRETDNGDVVILEESPIYKDQLYFVCIGYDDEKAKVLKVEKGSSEKSGNLLRISDFYTYETVKTRKDGVEYWNSVVRNESDRIESKYQKLIKNINSKLL